MSTEKAFVKIPLEVFLSDELTGNDIRVYGYIRNQYIFYQTQNRSYFESYKTIADRLGMTRNTVQKCIDNLTDQGLLQKHSEGKSSGRSCSFTVKDSQIRGDINTRKQKLG